MVASGFQQTIWTARTKPCLGVVLMHSPICLANLVITYLLKRPSGTKDIHQNLFINKDENLINVHIGIHIQYIFIYFYQNTPAGILPSQLNKKWMC